MDDELGLGADLLVDEERVDVGALVARELDDLAEIDVLGHLRAGDASNTLHKRLWTRQADAARATAPLH